MATEIKAL
jgi:hypothetical protein